MSGMTFFEGYSSGDLMTMLVVVLLFAIPQLGPNVVNWIKEGIGWSGKKAEMLFVGILGGVSLIAMFVTGEIVDTNFTLKTFISTFGAALVPARLAYRSLMGKDNEPEEEGSE